jgi:hypothetical protein
MRITYAVTLAAISLAACANNPASTTTGRANGWTAYRAEVVQARDRGELTPLQAEDRIAMKYRELYGRDPSMEGAFAYSKELYVQSQAGNIPMDEADALAKARIDEILARREARLEFHDWMNDRFPPEPSD